MVFLIEYDRLAGRLVRMDPFLDGQLPEAENARVALELVLNQQGVDHEVVLLQASTEEALRRTHRRYFANIAELLPRKAG